MRALKSLLLALLLLGLVRSAEAAEEQPNILWIIVDDMSANFSCYGETAIETPNVDRLAARGTRFSRAFVTAPVCSTCRSAFITGMYQTSIGAHHHRSGRGEEKIHLPKKIVPVPKLFQQAGYYTSVGSWPIRKGRLGKTDYNFEWDQSMYDGADWSGREQGQPFFAQIQLPGGKLRGGTLESARKFRERARRDLGSVTPLDAVELPPYYPDEPVLVEDWAAYLDSVRYTDMVVGQILDRLENEGVLEETVVFFMTDHGISHARGKQFLYDEGLHVPLVIAGQGVGIGFVRDDLVEHIDIAATSLGLAGIEIPEWMQARDILAGSYEPRDAVYAARDRCDETVDHLRSVRTKRFKYIRNFLPLRPHLQPNAYKDKKSILIALRDAHEAGRLDDVQGQLFASTRPPQELYDLENDPHEIHNLAQDPDHAGTLREMRGRLDRWMEETGDQGRSSEPKAMFESDMALYVGTLRRRKADPEHIRRVENNIELMRQWAAEGK
ncbi:Choline-sulfatase [Maioricimonas rarisocia]|uniref:Choline-sulfatase n=1 Tax=Maioricimonas rarisocia TaxID=2528026 RepID=A0A517Z7W0_9PLAN|nr:sulfatase [Maioricimonas rarisocia]QDU38539.1 Choline-sulfatase [Maioricimonas rarisocia]